MKTKSIYIYISILAFFFFPVIIHSQEVTSDDELELEEVTGVFKKYDANSNTYLFSVAFEDDDDSYEETIEFIIGNEFIKNKLNLNNFVGQKFVIKYTVIVKSVLNEDDGFEEFYEVYTIKELEMLK